MARGNTVTLISVDAELTTQEAADMLHVVAAAICGWTDVIVTVNLRDLSGCKLAPYSLKAQHPDEFILHLLDLAPDAVLSDAPRYNGGATTYASRQLASVILQSRLENAFVLEGDGAHTVRNGPPSLASLKFNQAQQ